MPRLSLEKSEQVEAAALQIVAAFGIHTLDNMGDEVERGRTIRALQKELRDETGISYYTARHKIAWACCRLRHPRQSNET